MRKELIGLGLTVALGAAGCSIKDSNPRSEDQTLAAPTTKPTAKATENKSSIFIDCPNLETIEDLNISEVLLGRPVQIAKGLTYYAYKRNAEGVMGTEKLSNPWIRDCTTPEGKKIKVFLTANAVGDEDNPRLGISGLFMLKYNPYSLIDPVAKDALIETDEGSNAWSPDRSGIREDYTGEQAILRLVPGSFDPSFPGRQIFTAQDDETPVMVREFFPNQTIEEVQNGLPQTIEA